MASLQSSKKAEKAGTTMRNGNKSMKWVVVLVALGLGPLSLWQPTAKAEPLPDVIVDMSNPKGSGMGYNMEDNVITLDGSVACYELTGKRDNCIVRVAAGTDLLLNNVDIQGWGIALDIQCSEEVRIWLADGSENNFDAETAIKLETGQSLVINGNTGVLNAIGGWGAGIGGRPNESGDGYDGGDITINGGTINASVTERGLGIHLKNYGILGDGGAGIGGGYGSTRGGNGGTVTINGGTVNSKSGMGAGIGGGSSDINGYGGDGGTVTINGGIVNAWGSNCGAGIGGGDGGILGGDGGEITINGGEVNARGRLGSGIGGGDGHLRGGDGGHIAVNSGVVNAKSESGAGIGGGHGNAEKAGDGGHIIISGGMIIAESEYGAGIGGGYSGYGDGGSGGIVEISGGSVTASSRESAGIGGGCGDATGGSGGQVSITGGVVNVTSDWGAGIGGGYHYDKGGSGGSVVIAGGSVHAVSDFGAGIGGSSGGMTGTGGDGGMVEIYGGTVKAESNNGAGIGGGASEGTGTGGTGGNGIIVGGSVNINGDTGLQMAFSNDGATPVYLNIIGNLTANTAVNAADFSAMQTTMGTGTVSAYGLHDVVADGNGEVHFWLPAATGAVTKKQSQRNSGKGDGTSEQAVSVPVPATGDNLVNPSPALVLGVVVMMIGFMVAKKRYI